MTNVQSLDIWLAWLVFPHLYFDCAFSLYSVTHWDVTPSYAVEHLILTLKHVFRVQNTYKIRGKKTMEG